MISEKIDEMVERIRVKATAEETTPKERVCKVGALQEPDRVPVITQLHDHAARISGIPVRDMATDSKKLVYAQLYGLEKYFFDSIVIGVDIYNIEVEAVGTRVSYPEWSVPTIVEHAVKAREDLKNLKMPDPETDGRMPYLIQASKIYQEKLGDLFPFSGNVASPFSIAANLRGFVNLLKDFREDPDFAHQLMRFSTDLCILWGEAQKEKVGFGVTMADAWGTLPNISPQIFEEFSLPYTAYAMGRLKCNCSSVCRGLRLFKDWRPWARKILSMGVSSYTVYQEDIKAGIDLLEVKRLALKHGRSFAIVYDPSLIQIGTRQEIQEKVREHIQKCAPGGAFLIVPNNIPADAPTGNVLCFVESIREFGKYPIDL